MYALRCTQKLLRRVGGDENAETTPPTTRLGDWYANVVMVGHRPFVLAISENTYLPVVVPLRESTTLLRRVGDQVGEVLVRLPVPQESFETELEEMRENSIGRTVSRRTVGVLVDFAMLVQARSDLVKTPIALSLFLARTPCGPLRMATPERATIELFRSRSSM